MRRRSISLTAGRSAMRNAYPLYDRRFSVMVWYGDEMVGHALFSPVRLRLMGETVRALLPNF